MDAFEIQERVQAVEKEKARAGRIDWYDRNAPGWWRNLKDLFNDPVWEEELDDYCAKWFGKNEAEIREFLDLGVIEDRSIAEQIIKKKLTNAEKQRAYRARKAGK
jgi:hypothetical protein